MKSLEIRDLICRTGDFTLSIEKLEIEEGKTTCLMGDNGSGKTTLLKAIASLIPFSGSVNVGSGRSSISYISQFPNLFRGTVRYNISYPLKIRKYGRKAVDEALERISTDLGISELLNRNVKTLSGGQARKVGLARALVYEPKLILLDEPLNNLDKQSATNLFKDIKKMIKKDGASALYVSHDIEEVLLLGDRLAIMDKGRIVQEGPVEAVLSEPISVKTAQLMDVFNVIKGKVTGWSEGVAVFEKSGFKVNAVSEQKDGQAIMLIKPSDIFISLESHKDLSARNLYKASICSLKEMGNYFEAELDCAVHLKAAITKQAVEELALKEGTEVNVYFKASAATLIKDQ